MTSAIGERVCTQERIAPTMSSPIIPDTAARASPNRAIQGSHARPSRPPSSSHSSRYCANWISRPATKLDQSQRPVGGNDAAQRHHQPVAEGEDQPADRVGKGNALRLHVQAQQAGAGEQAADHVQQERSNLEEHGTSS